MFALFWPQDGSSQLYYYLVFSCKLAGLQCILYFESSSKCLPPVSSVSESALAWTSPSLVTNEVGFFGEKLEAIYFTACFFPKQNLWAGALEFGVGGGERVTTGFFLRDIPVLEAELSVCSGDLIAAWGAPGLPLLARNHCHTDGGKGDQGPSTVSMLCPKQSLLTVIECWAEDGSPPLATTFAWNLPSAAGGWRQNEKCWHRALPGKTPCPWKLEGKRTLCLWLQQPGVASFWLSCEVESEEWSWFRYQILLLLLPNFCRSSWIDVSLFTLCL